MDKSNLTRQSTSRANTARRTPQSGAGYLSRYGSCMKIFIIFLFNCVLVACTGVKQHLSDTEVKLLENHDGSIGGLDMFNELSITHIRKDNYGLYFVVDNFFTDEKGYFVSKSDSLPEITGELIQVKGSVYVYKIRG